MNNGRSTQNRRTTAGWRATLLVVVLVLCSLLSVPAAAQGQEPDLDTYTGWVRAAYAAAQRNDRLGLEEEAGRLVATTSVRLPGGARMPVDNSWLRVALREPEPDLALIAARLGAIIDALAQPESAAPADALERLRQILDRPPFTRAESESALAAWWRAFWDWVVRVLERLFRPVGTIAPTTGNVLAWVIASIGAVLLLGVLGYLLLGLRRTLVAEARLADADPEARLTARTAIEQASDLARSGDYRTAVRYLYLSALLWLDEQDLLRYDRALTNREYLERARNNPALHTRLAPIVETFDRVWYGHTALDAASFAAYRAQIEALREVSGE
jgi:hypothetical protein